MFRRLLKRLVYLKGKREPIVFFDLPSSEKKKVIKKAIHMANKEQRDLLRDVSKKEWSFSCKN